MGAWPAGQSPADRLAQHQLKFVLAPVSASRDWAAGRGQDQRRSAAAAADQISASGKCDFLVGRKHNQLMVSLAPAGANLNLAEAFTRGRATPAPRVRQAQPLRPKGPSSGARRDGDKPAAAPVQISQAPAPSALPVPPPCSRSHPAAADRPPPAMAERTDQGRPTVVVDAGHGGHDPGTRSEDGLLEKDLALQIARRVADALDRRGVNAVLTRDRDVYLTLAQRTAIANRCPRGAVRFDPSELESQPADHGSGGLLPE